MAVVGGNSQPAVTKAEKQQQSTDSSKRSSYSCWAIAPTWKTLQHLSGKFANCNYQLAMAKASFLPWQHFLAAMAINATAVGSQPSFLMYFTPVTVLLHNNSSCQCSDCCTGTDNWLIVVFFIEFFSLGSSIIAVAAVNTMGTTVAVNFWVQSTNQPAHDLCANSGSPTIILKGHQWTGSLSQLVMTAGVKTAWLWKLLDCSKQCSDCNNESIFL